MYINIYAYIYTCMYMYIYGGFKPKLPNNKVPEASGLHVNPSFGQPLSRTPGRTVIMDLQRAVNSP